MRTNDQPGGDLVAELVLGKRSPQDPSVRASFRADPDLERRWKELSRTAELLEAARDFEAAMLAEVRAEGTSSPAADADVGRILREEARRPRADWRHWTLALAAGLLLVAWISFGRRDEPAGKAYLGGTGATPAPLAPVGTLDASALPSFRWTFAPDAGWEGHCVVVLYDASGSELLRSPEIREPQHGSTWEWAPEAPPVPPVPWLDPALTPTFFWQVSSVSSLGEVASSAPQEVRFSPSPR
jgi:hypothetical protein